MAVTTITATVLALFLEVCLCSEGLKTSGLSDIQNDVTVRNRLLLIENEMVRLNRRTARVEKLEEIIASQQIRLNQHDQKLDALKKENDMLKSACLKEIHKRSVNYTSSSKRNENNQNQRSIQRGIRAASEVAFSAWLGNPQDHLGIGHTLKFDQVVLNDGNAYNHLTGIFTCPASGVYGFNFWIATYNIHQLIVKIVVNGVNELDAIADGLSSTQDIQGGNSLIVRLAEGDTVWLESYLVVDDYIYGSNDQRYSSFSGHLIY